MYVSAYLVYLQPDKIILKYGNLGALTNSNLNQCGINWQNKTEIKEKHWEH